MTKIDGNISDLFFNTDISDAAEHDAQGNFTSYNGIKLLAEANLFLACLERLGVPVPSSNALIADFLARV